MDGKVIFSFLFGLAAGAGGAYLYLNDKYQKRNERDLEANRKFYEEKMKEAKSEPEETITQDEEPEESIPEAKRKADELAAKLNYNALYNKQPLGSNAAAKDEDMIFLISPEQYDSETLLERRVLTYWEGDDILTDELSDEIMDIEATIGLENAGEFGNGFEEDPYVMHVRNNNLGYVFEVTKDERSYSAVMENAE